MAGLIRTTVELEAVSREMRADGLVSLDTEFVWKSTYRPQLGLVQLASRSNARALDCLTALDFTPLKELVEDESIVKILHDARQDLHHIRHWIGAMPANVFDTQLAAGFAGFPAGIGLQRLLFEAIHVGLPKTETLTDWMRRPLSDAQIAYALDDVRYLAELKDFLVRRASERGTLEWLFEELVAREDSSYFTDADPHEVWKKFRLHRTRLDPYGRAVLREVAALREIKASEWNLPRNWLGDDHSLISMAETKRVGRLVHRLKGGRDTTLRALYDAAIAAALAVPEGDCPPDPNREYDSEVREAADHAVRWLAEKAESIGVEPTLIANRATVVAFVDDPDDESNPLAVGWRYEAVGAEMAELFAG